VRGAGKDARIDEKRMGARIAFGVLALIATVSMVADRNARTDGRRDLPW
jgi:hypothetical protein